MILKHLYTKRWFVAAFCIIVTITTGCASTPPPETVKPVTVRVTASDFCPIMRAVAPPTGTLTWVPTDSPETIDGVRAVNAAVSKRCVQQKPNS